MAKKSDYPVFEPFNPLDKRHLGASVANALLESDIYRLPPEPFIGAGVYALYYVGDFPAYEVLAEVNRNDQFACPIYVGKAVPDGARKGGQGDDVDPGTALYKRLNDHAKSVDAAANLRLEDFYCQFLSVDDIWIPLTESLLIERFKPVWNRVLDGLATTILAKDVTAARCLSGIVYTQVAPGQNGFSPVLLLLKNWNSVCVNT